MKVHGKKQCEVNCKMPILRPAYGNKKVKFSSSNLNFLMRITNPRMLISDKRVAVNPGGDSNMEQTGMLVGNFEFNP